MARPVTVTISHDLGKQGARARINDGFDQLKTSMTNGLMFRFTQEWSSEDTLSFTAKGLGQTITGTIDVFPAHVRITATLPGLLASLAETISGKIEKQGQILLEHK
ncbi:polyhydroxyalkanoic acid system family protein [Marinicaulis aureus]|uniref:Polyhydroxyalkanoic acid system family protein n=1 Tax=Hyphococcus aureus TaxID=2666033 RepID=A0ABW1L0C0_9PROT